MTARSHSQGNPIVFDEASETWVYADSKQAISESGSCAKCGKLPEIIRVKIPADLSSTGKDKWRECMIDACVAPLVKALQDAGIDMRGSCCGHNISEGEIYLQDGRVMLVLDNKQSDQYAKTGSFESRRK